MLPQLEDHREGVGNLHGAVPLLSGLPLRGAGDNADSFLVQRRVDTTEDLDVGNGTVGIDGELEGYTALNTVLLGDFGMENSLASPPWKVGFSSTSWNGMASSSTSSSSMAST